MSNETEQFVALQAMMEIYAEDPVQFVNDFMGCKPDPWQEDVLRHCFLTKHYAIAGSTGCGKSTLLSWIIIYFLMTRPFSKVICTATKLEQVQKQLWPEAHRWIRSSPKLQPFLKWTPTKIAFNHPKAENEWFAMQRVARTRSTGDGDRQAEGLAGSHADHQLVIADEASGIDEAAFDALDGLLTGPFNHFLVAGNPLRSSGRFWSIFNDPRYHATWARKSVSYLEAPRVDREWAERMIRTYGEHSPTVQARVFGKFPQNSRVDTCFSNDEVRDMQSRYDTTVPADTDDVQIGLDSARFGDDETVIVVRKGPKAVEMNVYAKIDNVEIAGHIIDAARRWALPIEGEKRPEKKVPIVLDSTGGYGGGAEDILVAEGYTVFPINFASSAINEEEYENRVAEMWLDDMRRWVSKAAIPEDEELFQQLVTRRYAFSTSGGGRTVRKKLEPKPKLKSRGLPSPDRADALIMAYCDIDKESGFSDLRFW